MTSDIITIRAARTDDQAYVAMVPIVATQDHWTNFIWSWLGIAIVMTIVARDGVEIPTTVVWVLP